MMCLAAGPERPTSRRFLRPTARSCVAALLLLAASCSNAAPTPTQSRAPLLSASASASGSTFSSSVYQYSIDLPDGWRPVAATEAWDGTSGITNEDPWVDQFISQRGTLAWAFAAPTSKTLDELTADQIASGAVRRCSKTPETDEGISVGQEPARFVVMHCPADSATLVAWADLVHDGDGYFFYFIYPESLAADPKPLDPFRTLLHGVQFR
jgi:hypothetical protein